MARPTFLIAETEPGAALSTRKLVMETAKFNVITAHSLKEAKEFLQSAPLLYSAVIIASELPQAEKVLIRVRQIKPELKIICVSPTSAKALKGADYQLSSYEPENLVELCRELFGDPRKMEQ